LFLNQKGMRTNKKLEDVELPRDTKERTFSFALELFRLCRTLDSKSRSLRILAQQLLRSETSVGANVEEAQAAQSRADFISKYSIALKEARETLYWLRLLDASGELSNDACKTLLREADEIARLIASIILSTKKGGRS
jgi:four helix bundle protein